jgi:hypothetical protein
VSVVLVDEAAEAVAATDLTDDLGLGFSGSRGCNFERTMRPLRVVMVEIDVKHAFRVAAVQDQRPIETL